MDWSEGLDFIGVRLITQDIMGSADAEGQKAEADTKSLTLIDACNIFN